MVTATEALQHSDVCGLRFLFLCFGVNPCPNFDWVGDWGMPAPAARAVVANADTSRSGERLGRLAAVETSGFVAGPVIGALLNEIWGLKAPFLVFSFVLTCLSFLLRIQLVGLVAQRHLFRKSIQHDSSCNAERHWELFFGCRFFPAGMYEAIWARFMEDLGASTLFVGVSLTMYGIPFAIVASMAGKFIDRSGPLLAAYVCCSNHCPHDSYLWFLGFTSSTYGSSYG